MYNNPMYQNIAESYWFEYSKIWPVLLSHRCPTIVINNRLSATAGVNYSEKNIVHLSGKFLVNNREEMLKVTLPHELAHQIDFILNGWKRGARHHRASWKAIMVKIGLPPALYHKMVL